MDVYAVLVFRTDTHKDPDRTVSLHFKKEDAQKHANNLNATYKKDTYCVLRARVEMMRVNGEMPSHLE